MRPRRRQPLWESIKRLDAAQAATASCADDVASPCIGVCALGAGDICSACFRSMAEISGWIGFTSEQKRAVLAAVAARRIAAG